MHLGPVHAGWKVHACSQAVRAQFHAAGRRFSKLAVAQPNASTMDEIGAAALGKTGKRLVFAIV